MNKPPAFQFYADDFVAGVSDMTQSEVGAYILLLCCQWNRGEIPTDPARASLIAKGEVTQHVMDKFPQGKNKRMERVREERNAWIEKSRNGGKSSASVRKGGSTTLQPPFQPFGNTPSPSPINNTHTSADFPEANVPTLTEVLQQARLSAVTPESATKFFNHHQDNQLWVNQFGRLIDWKRKMVNWQANDRSNQTNANRPTNRPTAPDRNAGTYNTPTVTPGERAKIR